MLGFRFAVFVIIFVQFVQAYDAVACCKQKWGVEALCDQQYSTSISAAEPLYVTHEYCASKCLGIGFKSSEPSNLRQWAGPLVRFVLPAIIFSFSVPRRKKIEFDLLFDFQSIARWSHNGRHQWFFSLLRLIVSLLLSTIILIPVIVDTILWITVIVVGAGNMLVAGLYEAYLDYRILQRVQDTNISLDDRTELLLTLVSGSLIIDPKFESPKTQIFESLSTSKIPSELNEQRRVRLLAMLGSQYSFGAAVGAPVLFYLSAFVYTIIDLKSDLSNLDAAVSLAFGVEWMVIVHVAIISGCLLASNNPSTSTGIVGHNPSPKPLPHRASTIPIMKLSNGSFSIKQIKVTEKISKQFPLQRVEEGKISSFKRALLDPAKMLLGWNNAYPTKFQTVWMWDRGSNKMEWIKTSHGWTTDSRDFMESMKFTVWGWFLKIYLPVLILVSVPPLAAAAVAYDTPSIGLSCRSLTFLVYATCQTALSLLSTVKNALESQPKPGDGYAGMLSGWKYWAWSSPFLLGSFVAIIGGMVLQLTQMFTTCLCYTSLHYWSDLDDAPDINVVSDTQEDRDSRNSWLVMGTVATGFMVITCYIGWWYQRLIRKRFILTVEDIYRCGSDENTSGMEMDNMGPSDDHGADAPLLSVTGDGAPLEEPDHEDSAFDA